jgi:hypothetical protein
MKPWEANRLAIAVGAVLGIGLAAPALSPAGTTDFELGLRGKKKQELKKFNVKAECIDVACTVRIKGRVTAFRAGDERTFRIERRRRSIERGAIRKISLRVKGRDNRRKLGRMLSNGGEAEAVVRGKATTADGSTDTAKKRVKLLPRGGGGASAAGTANATASAAAKCPKKTKAVAGGFTTPSYDPNGAGPAVNPFESRRAGKRRWTASGHNGGVSAGTFKVFAYCDKRPGKVKAKSAEAVADSGENGSATATCGGLRRSISGGFTTALESMFDSPQIEPFFASHRVGKRKWMAAGEQGVGGQPARLDALVYCGKPDQRLKAKSKQTTIGSFDTGSVEVKCPHGSRAISGGFSTPEFAPVGGPPGPRVSAYESRRKGKRAWKVSGHNGAAADPGVLEAFVYCEKGAPKLKKRSRTTTVPPQPD